LSAMCNTGNVEMPTDDDAVYCLVITQPHHPLKGIWQQQENW